VFAQRAKLAGRALFSPERAKLAGRALLSPERVSSPAWVSAWPFVERPRPAGT
jgi:hypothetical protein